MLSIWPVVSALTNNTWTGAEMHNGALGYVVDFVRANDRNPCENRLPSAVVVNFGRLADAVSFGGHDRNVAVPLTTDHCFKLTDQEWKVVRRTMIRCD